MNQEQANPYKEYHFLFLCHFFHTASTTIPILLAPSICSSNSPELTLSKFVQYSVLGTSIGKFLNGPIVDLYGARRSSILYSLCWIVGTVILSISSTPTLTLFCCFAMEFFASIQWPCYINLLLEFDDNEHNLEYTLLHVNLGSRGGAIVCFLWFYLFHVGNITWIVRVICPLLHFIGCGIMYSLEERHSSNIRWNYDLIQDNNDFSFIFHSRRIVKEYLIPSFRHVLSSGTFWVVSIAHSGSTIIKSSERILSIYNHHDSSILLLSFNLGLCLGLVHLGHLFRTAHVHQRKRFIWIWYGRCIACCYGLALFGFSRVFNFLSLNLIQISQIILCFVMGSSIAVQYYTIPGILATMFQEKGMYASFVDGVACAVTSLVWSGVLRIVDLRNGWAFAWMIIALVLVVCAVIMMEFLDYYFCFGRAKTKEENDKTIITPVREFIKRWNKEESLKEEESPTKYETKMDIRIIQQRLHHELSKSHNQKCADCAKPCPRWASIHSKHYIGCFICHDCAGIHIHYQISLVKSIDLDYNWQEWQIIALEQSGNHVVNSIFQHTADCSESNTTNERMNQEHYLQLKYSTGIFHRIEGSNTVDLLQNEDDDASSAILELVNSPSFKKVHHRPVNIVHDENFDRQSHSGVLSPITVSSSQHHIVDLLDDTFAI